MLAAAVRMMTVSALRRMSSGRMAAVAARQVLAVASLNHARRPVLSLLTAPVAVVRGPHAHHLASIAVLSQAVALGPRCAPSAEVAEGSLDLARCNMRAVHVAQPAPLLAAAEKALNARGCVVQLGGVVDRLLQRARWECRSCLFALRHAAVRRSSTLPSLFGRWRVGLRVTAG